MRYFFSAVKKIPAVDSRIATEKAKVSKTITASYELPGEKYEAIPEQGKTYEEVMVVLKAAQAYDQGKYGAKHLSGCIYLGNDAHTKFVNEAYGMFSLSNPLHAEVFPHVRRMEAEVVSMAREMMHGGPRVCGAMTSGGTESILMAVKSYRDWARDKKGVTKPELIVPITVHAAFDKACHYFGIKIVHIPLGADYKVDLAKVKRAVNRNTIAVVGSAPNFPHGMVDDIQALGQIALQHGIGLHVDCCLGGFLLPFVRELPDFKNDIPAFDFSVPGVTSISADTHKYGYTPKGTSIVLFSDSDLRSYMFFTCPDWTGGIYGSPTMAGSRPGGLSAAAWATLVHFGKTGYRTLAQGIMDTARKIMQGIKTVPQLYVLGDPRGMVISFSSNTINIFQVNAAMSKRGWSLSSLQQPVAVHICVTARHIGKADQFIEDLRASVKEVVETPEMYKNSSSAKMYGMAAAIPDRNLVKDLIIVALDGMLDSK